MCQQDAADSSDGVGTDVTKILQNAQLCCAKPSYQEVRNNRWFYISILNTFDHTVICADSIGTD